MNSYKSKKKGKSPEGEGSRKKRFKLDRLRSAVFGVAILAESIFGKTNSCATSRPPAIVKTKEKEESDYVRLTEPSHTDDYLGSEAPSVAQKLLENDAGYVKPGEGVNYEKVFELLENDAIGKIELVRESRLDNPKVVVSYDVEGEKAEVILDVEVNKAGKKTSEFLRELGKEFEDVAGRVEVIEYSYEAAIRAHMPELYLKTVEDMVDRDAPKLKPSLISYTPKDEEIDMKLNMKTRRTSGTPDIKILSIGDVPVDDSGCYIIDYIKSKQDKDD